MLCPKCKGSVQTLDTVNVTWNEIYRRKQCLACKHIFFTAEFEVEANTRFKKEWALYYKKRRKF
jgi:transcriptional regulator NrdR family protein